MDAIGFRTSSGSIYKFDSDTNYSTRLKVSPGQGQGEWQKPCMCMFVRAQKFDKFKADNFDPNLSLRLGWLSEDQQTLNIIGTDNRLDNVPDTGKPVIALVDKHSQQAVAALATLMEPTIGFKPIEKFYNIDGTSRTHPGNVIDKVYTEDWEMEQDLRSILENLSHPASSAVVPSSTAKQAFAQQVAAADIQPEPPRGGGYQGPGYRKSRGRTL